MEEEKQNPIKQTRAPEKSIRTYAGDMADAIRSGSGSLTKIALAESAKKESDLLNPEQIKEKKVYTMLSIGLITLGIIIVSLILFFKKEADPTINITTRPETLLRSDIVVHFDATGVRESDFFKRILETISEQNTRVATIGELTVGEQMGTETESLKQLTTNEIFVRSGARPPNQLIRSLEDMSTIGFYSLDINLPFFVIKNTSYENTFAGMLLWEKTLFDDLYTLFGIDPKEYRYVFEKNWQDMVIKNQDTRAVLDADEKPILFYTFLGEKKDILFIGSDPRTLEAVVSRLRGQTELGK